MPPLTRWICLRALARPWTWGLLLAASAAWPLSRRLFQLGLANWDRDLMARALEAGTLAGFLGALVGLSALGATGEHAARLHPLQRVVRTLGPTRRVPSISFIYMTMTTGSSWPQQSMPLLSIMPPGAATARI